MDIYYPIFICEHHLLEIFYDDSRFDDRQQAKRKVKNVVGKCSRFQVAQI